jgi:flagellar motility protein MotE (MotC chaperone)
MKLIQDIERSEQLEQAYQETENMKRLKKQHLEDLFFECLEDFLPEATDDQLWTTYRYSDPENIAAIMDMYWDEKRQEFVKEEPVEEGVTLIYAEAPSYIAKELKGRV